MFFLTEEDKLMLESVLSECDFEKLDEEVRSRYDCGSQCSGKCGGTCQAACRTYFI